MVRRVSPPRVNSGCPTSSSSFSIDEYRDGQRDVEGFRRAGKVQLLGDGDELPKLGDLHGGAVLSRTNRGSLQRTRVASVASRQHPSGDHGRRRSDAARIPGSRPRDRKVDAEVLSSGNTHSVRNSGVRCACCQPTDLPCLPQRAHTQPDEPSIPELELDETIAPRPEEEIADVLRANPDFEDHRAHPADLFLGAGVGCALEAQMPFTRVSGEREPRQPRDGEIRDDGASSSVMRPATAKGRRVRDLSEAAEHRRDERHQHDSSRDDGRPHTVGGEQCAEGDQSRGTQRSPGTAANQMTRSCGQRTLWR